MNVEGEGILLSEMRDMGMIENCGWFSRFIKKAAKVVAVVAVSVAVVAVVVATAAGTAAVIGGYAAITAAIASGVVITAELWEKNYPGIEVTVDNNIAYAKWNEQTKKAIKDIVTTQEKENSLDIYFPCEGGAYNPLNIQLKPVSREVMAGLMKTEGKSSFTQKGENAYAVAKMAFPLNEVRESDIWQDKNSSFVRHFHVMIMQNGVATKQHLAVNGKTIHSYFGAV